MKITYRIVAMNETGNATSDVATVDEAGEEVKRLLRDGYAVSVAAHSEEQEGMFAVSDALRTDDEAAP